MGKHSLEFALSALIGLGLGLTIGKRKCDNLKFEVDNLQLRNQCLEADVELLKLNCDGLTEANKVYFKLLTEKESGES